MSDAAPSPWSDGTLRALAQLRPNVAELSARAETAVLTPREPGLWPARWRLEGAARICALNGLDQRAAQYRGAAADAGGGQEPPAQAAEAGRAFLDKVAAEPAAVVAADIDALRAAGVEDADIVRLCELVAFVSYQCRVEIGHRLMEAGR